jgi:radical SAM protein with 4Fe4S-binding SPASM domain
MMRHPLERVPREPRTCVWEITRACNLRCIHCENFGGEPGHAELTLDEMLRVADSLAHLGCRLVDLTGGEPLCHPHWYWLARALKQRHMRTALVTNGTLFGEEHLERALSAGIEIVAFSLDGPKRVHDRIRVRPGIGFHRASPFEATIQNLQRALGRITTKVITQVNLLNLPMLEEMRALLRDLGVTAWQLQLCVPTGRALAHRGPLVLAPAHLDALTAFITAAQGDGEMPRIDTGDTIGYYTHRERLLRKRASGQGLWLGCQAGIRSVAITYAGKVRGCSILPPEFDAGDLHEESLEVIWRDASRFAFSTAFDPRKLEGDCRRCAFGALCRAGCTSMAYYTTGTVYSNPFCISRPGILDAGERWCDAPQGAVLP